MEEQKIGGAINHNTDQAYWPCVLVLNESHSRYSYLNWFGHSDAM